MAGTILVALTPDDVKFVRMAVQHYEIFASVSENLGEDRTAGMLRAQEFHAQQFLNRIEEASKDIKVVHFGPDDVVPYGKPEPPPLKELREGQIPTKEK